MASILPDATRADKVSARRNTESSGYRAVCDVDGEYHGGVWCFFHPLGLTETQHEVANDLRTFYQGATYTPKNGSSINITQLSDTELIKFNQDHRQEFAAANWQAGLAGPIAAGIGGAMLGANGTQVTSKTLWQDGKEHIDVENPNPGQRAGQIVLRRPRDSPRSAR